MLKILTATVASLAMLSAAAAVLNARSFERVWIRIPFPRLSPRFGGAFLFLQNEPRSKALARPPFM